MTVKKAIKYKTICPHCGSELEFELEEIAFEKDVSDFCGYVVCPNCGKKVRTHEGYWTKDEYYLLSSIEVIYEPCRGLTPPKKNKEGGPEKL